MALLHGRRKGYQRSEHQKSLPIRAEKGTIRIIGAKRYGEAGIG